jgi:hypothetical protein
METCRAKAVRQWLPAVAYIRAGECTTTARLGVIRHGGPEAWAAGAGIALARADGLLGAGQALTAQQVAEELDVGLGALAVTEHELARALNLERYAHRPGAA